MTAIVIDIELEVTLNVLHITVQVLQCLLKAGGTF
jgi:hypothetical protein